MFDYGRAAAIGVLLSLALHLVLALVLWRLPSGAARDARTSAASIAFEVLAPRAGEREPDPSGRGVAARDRGAPAPLEPGGRHSAQNIDAERPGAGGDAIGAMDVVLLAVRDEAITLQDSPMNTLAVWQTQRIRTAPDRASAEDRRATPSPLDVPFLASGTGPHPERRPVASTDPLAGARIAPPAASLGTSSSTAAELRARAGANGPATPRVDARGALAITAGGTAAPTPATGDATMTVAAAQRGTDASSPGRGIQQGAGARESESARVAYGRPPVDQGPAATTTVARDARVRDDRDSELLAASMLQSMVESSARRGRATGAGVGGVGGGGAPGVGGSEGAGGLAAPHGPGRGAFDSLDTSDGRYRRWFLDQRARVDRALRFPHDLALSMDQGTSVYRVVVRRDGTLAHAPSLVRSSGFDEFDRAARLAIDLAAPFPPLPADLAPGLAEIRVTLPVEFSNPMVH